MPAGLVVRDATGAEWVRKPSEVRNKRPKASEPLQWVGENAGPLFKTDRFEADLPRSSARRAKKRAAAQ